MSPDNIIKPRHRSLARILDKSRLDAFALNPGPSFFYLTGLHFHLSERPVIGIFLPTKRPAIILPELEEGKLERLPFPVRSFPYGEDPTSWEEVFEEAIRVTGLARKRVGIETRQLRVLELRLLQNAAPDTFFLGGEDELAALRMFKDPQEISAMRKGTQVAERALEATLPLIKIGMTERELANELVVNLLRQGSNPEFPFSPIVQSGPNTANPHGKPTDRKLSPGDLLLIDWGANVDDYFSDITRTFAIGEIDPELEKIGVIVLEANSAAREKAGPGVEAGQVDQAARSIILKAGYGKYFLHRTGHGLGLEGHEEPYIRNDNRQPLQPGMTFTIEPGIYIPQRGGVRIEDDVLITEDGLESLTTLPRELKRIV